MRRHPGTLATLVLLTLAPVLTADDDRASDKRAVRDAAEAFLAAFAKKDLGAVEACWSPDSPLVAAFRDKYCKKIFDEYPELEVGETRLTRWKIEADRAELRLRFAWKGSDPKAGSLDDHTEVWNVRFVKEKGAWKWWDRGLAVSELGNALLRAKTKPERAAVLKDDKEMVGPALLRALRDACDDQVEHGTQADALFVNDVALEAAEFLGDDVETGRCRVNRAFVFVKAEDHPSALQNFRAALKLFQKAGDRPEEADALCNAGLTCQSMGKHEEALDAYAASLKLLLELKDRGEEAVVRENTGIVHESMGRPDEALAAYEACLQIRRELKDLPGQVTTLGRIGNLYYSARKYADAVRTLEDRVAILRGLGDKPRLADTLHNLGLARRGAQQYAESLRAERAGLEIALDLKDVSLQAEALNGVGVSCRQLGRYREAKDAYEERLAIARKEGDRKGESGALNNIANVLADLGDYEGAMRLCKESLAVADEVGDAEGRVRSLHNTGLVHENSGHYGEALRCYEACLRLERARGDKEGQMVTLNEIGNIYDLVGLRDEALRSYKEGLRLARELEDKAVQGVVWNNLGLLYRDAGRYEEALAAFEANLKVSRDLGLKRGQVLALNSIAGAHFLRGEYGPALASSREALEIARADGDRSGQGAALNDMGYSYSATGKEGEALQSFGEALKAAEPIGDGEILARSYSGIAELQAAHRRWGKAVEAYRGAIRSVEYLRAESREPSLKTRFFERHTSAYTNLAVCLQELKQSAEAFRVSEQVKARTLVELLRQGKTDARRGMTDDEKEQEQTLEGRLNALGARLEALRSQKADAAVQAALVLDLEAARRDYENFRRELYLRRPEVETRQAGFAPAAPDDLNHALFADRPGLVVLSYLVGDKETLLFVLTAGDGADDAARLSVRRLDVGSKDLVEAVDAYRAACADPAAAAPDSEELYRWLIAPAAAELASAKQVVIVPDGVLHVLPFQTLQDPDGKYLIERFAVSYAPSVTALTKMEELGAARRKQYADQPPSLLAVGVADFGRRERPLPAAEKEARSLAGAFGKGAKLLPGAEATRAQVEACWGAYRYLHFATHGRLDPDAPFYSSLVLSPAGAGDEGVLYARDLANADVPAELAVMSACETGLGERVRGEGLLGLSWSWFAAGVPSTVASQWSVGDASTARLMKTFYARLAAGDSKAEALRLAELTLLADTATRHPYYWAPFVLVGDDR